MDAIVNRAVQHAAAHRSSWLAIGAPLLLYVFYRAYKRVTRKSFKGKVVVITGCSSGIGVELAYQFAGKGAKLVLCARRVDRLAEVVEQCKKLGTDAIAVACDVTKEQDCKNLIESAVKKFGTVDTLVLNAGQGCLLQLKEVTTFDQFRTTMDTNYWGCVYPTYYALNYLRQSKGTIIVVSSLAAKIPTPRRSMYAASKSALHGFFNALRVEEPNIQTTIVCPGFVLSEIHDKAFAVGKVERKKDSFMTAERCAQIIHDAAAEGRREEVMTFLGKFGALAYTFIPGVVDWLGKLIAESSVKHHKE